MLYSHRNAWQHGLVSSFCSSPPRGQRGAPPSRLVSSTLGNPVKGGGKGGCSALETMGATQGSGFLGPKIATEWLSAPKR